MDFCSGIRLYLHSVLQWTRLTTLIPFVLHSSLIPEVYKIEAGDSELFGDSHPQEQHFFVLGDNHSNDSGITADLIQRLYTLFSSGELMVNDKEEPHLEEAAAPANDKQGNLHVVVEDLDVLLPGWSFPLGVEKHGGKEK